MTTPLLGQRPRGKLSAWLALAAMLWHAVVPVYAMAAMGDQDAERIPIRTPGGLVWFELDDEGQLVHFNPSTKTPSIRAPPPTIQ